MKNILMEISLKAHAPLSPDSGGEEFVHCRGEESRRAADCEESAAALVVVVVDTVVAPLQQDCCRLKCC